jgi:hypothetical protein
MTGSKRSLLSYNGVAQTIVTTLYICSNAMGFDDQSGAGVKTCRRNWRINSSSKV